jgi:hypothetical protein
VLVEAAWSGNLSEPVVGREILLADAIQCSSTLLDKTSIEYIVQISVDQTLVMGDAFNRNRFTWDVLTSFQVSIIICFIS